MITYICRNKDIKTGEDLPCTNTVCKTSICPSCGQRADAGSQIYWCKSYKTPIYEEVCPICNKKGKKLATDLRPVFPEERLLLELILGTPYAFLEKSVWNGSGNHYYVDGKRIPFSVKDLKQLNIDKVREEYQKYQGKNTDRYFKEQMEIFLQANRERYEALVEEADEYIRRVAADYNFMEMFVSFSGGKDSTVVSDLVMRALGNPKVLHIFGDTTLEFPFTYEYVKHTGERCVWASDSLIQKKTSGNSYTQWKKSQGGNKSERRFKTGKFKRHCRQDFGEYDRTAGFPERFYMEGKQSAESAVSICPD